MKFTLPEYFTTDNAKVCLKLFNRTSFDTTSTAEARSLGLLNVVLSEFVDVEAAVNAAKDAKEAQDEPKGRSKKK